MATCGIADLNKIVIIFEAFDTDKDERLNAAELTKLIQHCNPKVCFSVVQLEAVVEEVSLMFKTLRTQLTLRFYALMSCVLLAFLVKRTDHLGFGAV